MLLPLVLLAIGADLPPVLLEPQAARAWALAHGKEEPRRAAEVLLLASDPSSALDVLWLGPPPTKDPRSLRLSADAKVALGHPTAREELKLLAGQTGWSMHARRQEAHFERAWTERLVGRFGLGVFALALALLVVGGARELIRPGIESVVAAAALFAALCLARLATPAALMVVGLFGASFLALIHAAAATFRRTRPGPRGRAFLVAVLFLGVLGASVAVFAQLPPLELLSLLAAPVDHGGGSA